MAWIKLMAFESGAFLPLSRDMVDHLQVSEGDLLEIVQTNDGFMLRKNAK